MAHPLTSHKKATIASTSLFLLGLIVLVFTNDWWPGIMLAMGLSLALRQYLLGRNYDMGISLLVFVGTYVTVTFDISWKILLPVLFSIGSLYVLCREFLESGTEPERKREEDFNHEIEEKKEK